MCERDRGRKKERCVCVWEREGGWRVLFGFYCIWLTLFFSFFVFCFQSKAGFRKNVPDLLPDPHSQNAFLSMLQHDKKFHKFELPISSLSLENNSYLSRGKLKGILWTPVIKLHHEGDKFLIKRRGFNNDLLREGSNSELVNDKLQISLQHQSVAEYFASPSSSWTHEHETRAGCFLPFPEFFKPINP